MEIPDQRPRPFRIVLFFFSIAYPLIGYRPPLWLAAINPRGEWEDEGKMVEMTRQGE